MTQHKILFAVLVCIFGGAQVLGACGGGDDRPGNLPAKNGGTGGADDGGDSETSAGGAGFGGFGGKDGGPESGTGATGGNQPGAPVVTVTSPAEATDPVADDVVIGDQLTALCTAVPSTVAGAQPVDPSTVKLALLDGSAVIDEFDAQPTTTPNEYSATFPLGPVATGPFSVRCTAGDTSTPPKTGSDTVGTFMDHGPDITVTTPASGSAYALTAAVPFAFKVEPALLAATDPEADVTSVTLSTNGVSIPATPDPGVVNGYKLSVNFADTLLFPQPPNGPVPVVIKGTNSRTPTAVEKTESYSFIVDGAGPVIVIKSPKNQDVIGGQVTLGFSVVDNGSGVDKNTVAVELNQTLSTFGPSVQWTNNNDDYTFTFDSANITGSKVQVTVNVTASDLVGNDSTGATVVLYLDNQPPIVDLDSENVRTRKEVGLNVFCSRSFDPLGFFAANDLETVTPFKHFRALIWEQTNFAAGQTVLYYAKTEPSSVYLYLQADGPTVPLLINNDADVACDALNTVVNGLTLPNLKLNPVNPAGNAWYGNGALPQDPTAPPPIAGFGCTLGAENQPPNLCTSNASDLSVVIRHTMSGVEPVVYGIGGMTGLECTGTGWELSSQLTNATQKEGWFCLAATAKDKVGNASVSAPLRVCYDDPLTSFEPLCKNSSIAPPTCTDGCTPPAGFPATIFPPP